MARVLVFWVVLATVPSVRAQDTAVAEPPEGATVEAAAADGTVAEGAAPADDDAAGDASEPAEPTAPPVHDPTLMTIGIVTASIGVVSFGVLAATAVVERGRVAEGCGGVCSSADRDGADGLGIAANVAAGVALVGAALSLVGIAVMGRPEDDEPAEREEEITVSFSPAGVVVTGTF